MNKKRKIGWIIAASVLLVLLVGVGIYLGVYYHADDTALAALVSDQLVCVEEQKDRIIFSPEQPTAGLIFYPGGKVEHKAYAPLMRALAERGILCVLMEMPFRLAVFDVNAADGVKDAFPQIQRWYMGGHSLGGSMAASYIADHKSSFEGLILLAAYSTEDLSDSGLEVLSLYGDCDEVMNRKKYDKNRENLPDNTQEYVISGGNHAQFGSYGEQSGDGRAQISPQEQQTFTADKIAEFVNGKSRTISYGPGF